MMSRERRYGAIEALKFLMGETFRKRKNWKTFPFKVPRILRKW